MSSTVANQKAEIDKSADKLIKALGTLNFKAVPQAAARAINQTARELRSHGTKDAAARANVKDFHIRRKLHKRRQYAAKPFKNKLAARVWVGLDNPTAISMFMNARTGELNADKILKQKKGRGVKVPGRSQPFTFPKAFVSKGDRRARDPAYSAYLQKRYKAGANVLKGKYWQVLQRTGSRPYPLKVHHIPIKRQVIEAFRSHASQLYKPGGRAAQELNRQLMLALSQQLGKIYVA